MSKISAEKEYITSLNSLTHYWTDSSKNGFISELFNVMGILEYRLRTVSKN